MVIRNPYILFALVSTILSILIILPAIPRQYAETKRPRNEFTKLRWYLLAMPLVYIVCVLPRIPRLIQLIDDPPASGLAAVTTIGTSIGLLVFALFIDLIFTYRAK